MKRYSAAVRGLAGLLGLICVLLGAGLPATGARAQSPVIDISKAGATVEVIGDFPPVETDKRDFSVAKPGSKDTIVLQARGPGPRFRWIMVGIVNSGTTSRDMAITIPDQGFAGSGLYWPKPPGSSIVSVVATDPLSLQRLADTGKTAYGLTLEGGKLGAIAFEIIGPPPNSITLWQREAYDEQRGSFAFLRGALLGIAALLAAGMFSLYGLRSRPVFLAAGGFAVAAVIFMAQEAGHFQTLARAIGLRGLSPSIFRAVTESLMACFLLIYLAKTSELRRVMPIAGDIMLAGGLACLLILVYGLFDPLVAAGLARLIFCAAAISGFVIVYMLWRRGQTRAETAMLCWSVILAWTFLAFIVLASDPRSVSLSPVLLAGLCAVLVVMAFSLANYAFSHRGMSRHFSHEAGRRALALAGARAYVWDWQADEGELHVGEELETALGLEHGAIVDEGADAFIDRIHPADRGSYLVSVEAAEEQGNGLIDRQFRMRHGDGSYRWFHLRGRAMPGPNKRAARCIGTLTDVTSAKISEERLITDAVHDLVTGLPNRALFIDRLSRAIAVADRFRSLTVAVIDIDRFRVVNDVLGHEAGDHLLTVISRRLSSVIKATDSIARLTGGQFGAFFASETEAHDPLVLTDTLHSAFSRAIDVDGQEVYLTACIGLCVYRGDGAPAEEILADAAIALYEAKRRGHDSFEVFRPSMRDERAELALRESELRRAIDRGEFEVHYQPIARLDDMTLAGFEALVRWRHPKLGLLAPESFIALAEQTGMIKEIGRI
ncbi:MAG: diguanylate cyclase, partial [Alphaproteobacteria bacterium]|nr:diguanylate cyclase [Alphaproteobacteria bacterium]